jgi:hypothetical protein
VKGRTPEGQEIELTPVQEQNVRTWFAMREAGMSYILLPAAGKAWGKSVVTATIDWLTRNKDERTWEYFPENIEEEEIND